MSKQPVLRISPSDLDVLMSTLDVQFVALAQCYVSKGHRLELGGVGAPGIHYNLAGMGSIYLGDGPAIAISPHTLIIVPPNTPFRIEVADEQGEVSALKTVDGASQMRRGGTLYQFVAGDGEPEIKLICGYFRANYGPSTDLFEPLLSPIVEQFDAGDQLDHKLKAALAELVAEQVGCGAMSASLLKLVIVSLLRRSLCSINLWVERFSVLSDPQIASAFSRMVAHPGGQHTIQSLAASALLSRSAFMARFAGLFGRSPMAVLRDLRMRQAAQQLKIGILSIDEIAHNSGYESRSSFARAFREAYHSDPSEYRASFKNFSKDSAPGEE